MSVEHLSDRKVGDTGCPNSQQQPEQDLICAVDAKYQSAITDSQRVDQSDRERTARPPLERHTKSKHGGYDSVPTRISILFRAGQLPRLDSRVDPERAGLLVDHFWDVHHHDVNCQQETEVCDSLFVAFQPQIQNVEEVDLTCTTLSNHFP